jgi:hypothetical protein
MDQEMLAGMKTHEQDQAEHTPVEGEGSESVDW